MMIYVLAAVAAAAVLTVFWLHFSVKREDERKAAYREENIEFITLTDGRFGEMRFEKDSLKNTLICREIGLPFGGQCPELRVEDYEEEKQEFFFENLAFLYDRQEEITENLLRMTMEAFSVSREELRKSFAVTRICIQRYGRYLLGEDPLDGEPGDRIITVEGSIGTAEKGYPFVPVAYMNCRTREIGYEITE